MKVLQVIDKVKLDGGAEALQLTLARAFQNSDIELKVFTIRENEPEVVAKLAALGVEVRAFPQRHLYDLHSVIPMFLSARRERFDLIHTHLTGSTILGALIGKLLSVPVVTTLHSTVLTSRDHFIQGRLEPWVLKHLMNAVIACGKETAEVQQQNFPNTPITVIPNAVAPAVNLAANKRTALRRDVFGVTNPDDVVLLSVGRLVDAKGFFDMLDMMAVLRESCPAARLVIVGRGELDKPLRQHIDKLGIGDHARLVGPRSDVPRLLAASDIYVSTSHWEGLPIAILEAMASSLPVVATAVGDCPVVLGQGAGLLVPPRDPRQFAAVVAGLIGNVDSQKRLAVAAKQRVDAEYNIDAWGNKLRDLYTQVVRSRGNPPAVSPTKTLTTTDDGAA